MWGQIAQAVSAIVGHVSGGIVGSRQAYSERVVGTSEARNAGALNRNLPIIIVLVVLMLVFVVINVKKQ